MSQSILMVIAPQQFRDEELFEPLAYFESQGYTVTVASTQTGEATGMLGKTYTVTETLTGKPASAYEALVVVGGMGSIEYLWDNRELHELIKAFDSAQKVVSAICLSPAVLAKAGVLNGKKATVWECPESLEALSSGGTLYSAEDVIQDGRLVTANGPHAATAFAKTICEQLQAVTAS